MQKRELDINIEGDDFDVVGGEPTGSDTTFVSDTNDPRLQQYTDSLNLYNMGLSHVNKAHPELGQNPQTVPFSSDRFYGMGKVNFTEDEKKAYTTEEYEHRENILELYSKLRPIYQEALLKNRDYKFVGNNPDSYEYKLTKKPLTEIGRKNLEFRLKDMEAKKEHFDILQESLLKGIYPVGEYKDEIPHDPAFQKPSQPVMLQDTGKNKRFNAVTGKIE